MQQSAEQIEFDIQGGAALSSISYAILNHLLSNHGSTQQPPLVHILNDGNFLLSCIHCLCTVAFVQRGAKKISPV